MANPDSSLKNFVWEFFSIIFLRSWYLFLPSKLINFSSYSRSENKIMLDSNMYKHVL